MQNFCKQNMNYLLFFIYLPGTFERHSISCSIFLNLEIFYSILLDDLC